MEINPHNQLLSSPSPLLIKTRKLFLELVGMRVGLVPQLPHQSLLVDAVVSCRSVCNSPSSCESLTIWCVVAACLSLLSGVCFPHCGRILLSFCRLVSVLCVSVCCVGSHVVNWGLKLWVITPIMNHHALFRLSSPKGIDCIMKTSFSRSNSLCPYITLLTTIALHKKSDNYCMKLNLNI